ncbi:MAG: hypothetical protein ACQEQC_00430 [Elusimicrobiota bacterium]
MKNILIKDNHKSKTLIIILLFSINSLARGADRDFIKEKVLDISQKIVESSAETIPEKPEKFRKNTIEFYSKIDGVATPREILLGEELISYQVPLKSGNNILGMIYITPDGKYVTEWPGYRENILDSGIYTEKSWQKVADVPLVVRKDLIKYPKLIKSDKPSFLPRVGSTSKEGEQSAWDFSPEALWPFLVDTEIEKVGDYPLNRQWGYPVNPEWSDFVIDKYDKIPDKNLQEKKEWINKVNKAYGLNWNHLPGERAVSGKCLSYAASYISDWFKIKNSTPPYEFNYYISYLRGEKETGMNPRVLELLYGDRIKKNEQKIEEKFTEVAQESEKEKLKQAEKEGKKVVPPGPEICPLGQMAAVLARQRVQNMLAKSGDFGTGGLNLFKDSVTGEVMTSNLETYAEILSSDWESQELQDKLIRDFEYNIFKNPSGIKEYEVLFSSNAGANEQVMKEALEDRGIILAGIIYRTFGLPLEHSIHSAAVIGYKDIGEKTHFIYKEVFGEHDWNEPETAAGGPSYRMMPIEEFNEAYAFID